MTKVMVSDEIEASAEAVWALVRDFGGIERWNGGAVEGVTVSGDGVGAVRTIAIAGGLSLKEKLEAYDEVGRSFSYSFEGDTPLPLDDYYATLTVVPTGEGACRVEWGSSFEPRGVGDEQAVPMVEGIYRNGIAGIKGVLED